MPERAVKTPRQRSGGSLGGQAKAGLANLMNDIEGNSVGHDTIMLISTFTGFVEPLAGLHQLSELSRNAWKGNVMSAKDTYLAVFLGSKTSPRALAWNAMPEAERGTKAQEGMAAWKAWAEKHHAAIVAMGGPLGKTKKVTPHGVEDVSNEMGAYTIVRADSHQAAARLFEDHPHFTIFPGESVEIMPVLPVPGG